MCYCPRPVRSSPCCSKKMDACTGACLRDTAWLREKRVIVDYLAGSLFETFD